MNFKKIKLMCIDRKVTVKELAFLLGISRQTFYTQVQKETFTESEKQKIATQLKCDVSEL